MIELIEGAPGAGKSLLSVRDRLLYWFHDKRQRPLYVHCRGVSVQKWAALFHVPLDELENRMVVWPWEDHEAVPSLLLTVKANAFVFIDEAQFVFRTRIQLDADVIRWFETHRHRGIDVVLTCQDYRQMTSAVTRLVEVTHKCVRLSFLGVDRLSQVRSRCNPEDSEVYHKFPLKFDRKTVTLYESYADGVAEEVRRIRSIWRSPFMLAAGVAVLFVAFVFAWRPWTSLAQTGEKVKPVEQATGQPVPIPGSPPEGDQVGKHDQWARGGEGRVRYAGAHGSSDPPPELTAPPPSQRPKVRIVGRVGSPRDDRRQEGPQHGLKVWRYLLDTGEVLTAEGVALAYGLIVREIDDPFHPGFKMLWGPGIEHVRGNDGSGGH